MRCAARRRSAACTALLCATSSLPLTASQSLKRTSMRPSASRVAEPAASASLPRPRHSVQLGELVSSSAPPPSTMRNTPLRSRSARTIAEIAWPARSSSRNLTIEIGSWVAPTPEISTRNWAHAGAASAPAAQAMTLRLFNMTVADPDGTGRFNLIRRGGRAAPGSGSPALILLVALRVAVEGLLEVRERDHEAGPAVEQAALEDQVLDEGPGRARQRARHRGATRRDLRGAERRIAVQLRDDLAEVAERELPDRMGEHRRAAGRSAAGSPRAPARACRPSRRAGTAAAGGSSDTSPSGGSSGP